MDCRLAQRLGNNLRDKRPSQLFHAFFHCPWCWLGRPVQFIGIFFVTADHHHHTTTPKLHRTSEWETDYYLNFITQFQGNPTITSKPLMTLFRLTNQPTCVRPKKPLVNITWEHITINVSWSGTGFICQIIDLDLSPWHLVKWMLSFVVNLNVDRQATELNNAALK